MFLPLSDQPNPKGIPAVNYLLLGLNLAVFLFYSLPLMYQAPTPGDPDLAEFLRVLSGQLDGRVDISGQILSRISAHDLALFRHGFRPARPQIIDLLTSMFLHAGWLHLIGNMLFLWIYGDNVEYRLGRAGYLAAYLGTGIAATLFHSFLQPGSELPTVGASGAISGVLGFYFVWFPRNQVRVLLFFFPIFSRIVLMPARWVLGIYLVLYNLLPFLLSPGRGGGVAHGAHIGGFLAGMGAAYLLRGWEVHRRPAGFRREKDLPGEGGGPEKDLLSRALQDGRLGSAAAAYFRLSRNEARNLISPEDLLRLGDFLREEKQADGALFLYQRLLADYPKAGIRDQAHLGAGLVQFYGRRQPTAAYQHFLAVLDLDPSPEAGIRARQEISRIQHLQKLQIRGRAG